MELVGRMMDGTISYGDRTALEPVPSSESPKQDDKMERLESVPLFQACTRKQLRAIARIAGVFDAPADTVLIRAGERGEEFFLIVEGTARVHVTARKRVRLRAGDYFGEMSLLDGGPRSATVVAETPLRLLVISRQNFQTLLDTVPGLIQALLVNLCQRVRTAERRLDVSRVDHERSESP
jgi:CRP/FNR family transcriptional regulator, cyclic AMP receptor protein